MNAHVVIVKRTLVAVAVALFMLLPALPASGAADNVIKTWPGGVTQMPGECEGTSCG